MHLGEVHGASLCIVPTTSNAVVALFVPATSNAVAALFVALVALIALLGEGSKKALTKKRLPVLRI